MGSQAVYGSISDVVYTHRTRGDSAMSDLDGLKRGYWSKKENTNDTWGRFSFGKKIESMNLAWLPDQWMKPLDFCWAVSRAGRMEESSRCLKVESNFTRESTKWVDWQIIYRQE